MTTCQYGDHETDTVYSRNYKPEGGITICRSCYQRRRYTLSPKVRKKQAKRMEKYRKTHKKERAEYMRKYYDRKRKSKKKE